MKLLIFVALLVYSTLSYIKLEKFENDYFKQVLQRQQEFPGVQDSNIEDLNTFSNYRQIRQTHFELNWELFLNEKIQSVDGTVDIEMYILDNQIELIQLDVWDQKIDIITLSTKNYSNQEATFSINEMKQETEQGQQLNIVIPQNIKQDSIFNDDGKIIVSVKYSFDSSATAVSFLTAEQTSTKVLPYLFSQSEPIYSRSMFPCQDTPSVKSTYVSHVTAQEDFGINVFMSAKKTGITKETNTHHFEMSIPIPTYLVAIVAGNVVEQYVGKRTSVIAEPDVLEISVHDLEDLEVYIETIENYTEIDYIWEDYKIVIMPPSFPFGGMENPLLTFASPSIIVGDKSGANVAIHEIAHSWTGNMVTCANWTNMWMNEGFTVFLERKAQDILYGYDFMQMEAIVGNSTAQEDYFYFGLDSFSTLQPETGGKNPDDSFSDVPYEKGFQFLTYIQYLIGEENMQKLLKGWINANTYQSIVAQQFKAYTIDFIQKNVENPKKVLKEIDWDTWLYKPQNPPYEISKQIEFFSPQYPIVIDLVDSWINTNGVGRPKNWEDLLTYSAVEVQVFLDNLYTKTGLVTPQLMANINDAYNFNTAPNKEIAYRWYKTTIMTGYTEAKDYIFKFLGEIGRQKMVTPQYQAYVDTDQRAYGIEVYMYHYEFYHPIARISIEQILEI